MRLLAREKLKILLPAVELFVKESGLSVEVRSGSNFHDRYVCIDSSAGYHSGASFKDGAVKSSHNAHSDYRCLFAVLQTYDRKLGKVEYPFPKLTPEI